MRYLLFDEDAISKYASVSVMQSIEYATAQEFIKYVYPLIQGEPDMIYKNGLPVHIMRWFFAIYHIRKELLM